MHTDFSRPGKPTDNAWIESFNGRPHQECLNAHWFLSLKHARCEHEEWRRFYSEQRTHQGTMCCGRTPLATLEGRKQIWQE